MKPSKLYCYVDETGQDTKGRFFLVAVVLENKNAADDLEKRLEEIEHETGKHQSKWKKTSNRIKKLYLGGLVQLKELKGSIYYSQYHTSKEYSWLTSLTISKALQAKANKSGRYAASIIIDGLNESGKEAVRKELKKLNVSYHKIRGMRDEQSVFLRLADAMAGFLRDATEGESYSQVLLQRFIDAKMVAKV